MADVRECSVCHEEMELPDPAKGAHARHLVSCCPTCGNWHEWLLYIEGQFRARWIVNAL